MARRCMLSGGLVALLIFREFLYLCVLFRLYAFRLYVFWFRMLRNADPSAKMWSVICKPLPPRGLGCCLFMLIVACCSNCLWGFLFCGTMSCLVLSSAIIKLRKRELIGLLHCVLAVTVLCLFHVLPWVLVCGI